MPELSTELNALKSRLKDTWSSGDFGQIGRAHATGNVEFVERLSITLGMKVLDVACGAGTASIAAALAGAEVTGVDIAQNLIDQAIANAKQAGVIAKFKVGDAEDLPYEDGGFDLVMTMFGAMFAPRPDVTASELIRVCKPGGLIAMANWTPDSFTGQTFKLNAKYNPPPAEIPAPVLWGSEDVVGQRFSEGISDLRLTRRKIFFELPFGPDEVAEHFLKYFGPTKRTFELLDKKGQDALRKELVDLWTMNNQATDGMTKVESEYLEVIGTTVYRNVPKDRRGKSDIHILNSDGMVACNPRDREAAHRAAIGDISIGGAREITCRKCLDSISKEIGRSEQNIRK
jgi:SAM-dependent methyltransferase